MCDPLTIAGLALTAGSTVANYAAQRQVQAARDDALAAERIRQNTLNQEADALNLTSRTRFGDFVNEQEDRAQFLGDYFAGENTGAPVADANTVTAALPTSTSSIVVRDENQQRADARDFTDSQGEKLGQLRAFGDLLADKSLLQARDAGLVGQIGGFKRGSAAVVPYELDEANKAGDGMRFLGDLLGGFGSVASTAGLSGGSLPFFTAPAAKSAVSMVPGIGSIAAAAPQGVRLGRLYG